MMGSSMRAADAKRGNGRCKFPEAGAEVAPELWAEEAVSCNGFPRYRETA
jgi:hypothetical protein